MSKKRVNTVFEILLEQIEFDVNDLQEEGAQSIKSGNYQGVRGLIEDAEEVTRFRQKVKSLQSEWQSLKLAVERNNTNANHQPRGLRTPDEAFRKPILESIVELGGAASMEKILDRVEQKMQATINEYDRELLSESPRTYRWQNTVNWSRNALADEGLLNNNTSQGVWEITSQGRAALQDGRLGVVPKSSNTGTAARKPGGPVLPKPGGSGVRIPPPKSTVKRPSR